MRPPSSRPQWCSIKLCSGQAILTLQDLSNLPPLNADKQDQADLALIPVHFAATEGNFYAIQFDPEAGLFFGLMDLGPGRREWGLIHADQLLSYRDRSGRSGMERDAYWRPRSVAALGL
jgi:hypothetical protein